MVEVELRKCPYCKSDAYLDFDIMHFKKREIVAIECKRCGVRMHRHIDYRKGDYLIAEEIVKELCNTWNTRKKVKQIKEEEE